MELRWYKSVDDSDYKLQMRYVNPHTGLYTDWYDVPYVLEGVE